MRKVRSVYVYGILSGAHRIDLGEVGLPDGHQRVTTLPLGQVTAVVSAHTGLSFTSQPRQVLLPCLVTHQTVLELASVVNPVLPVKFGTVFTSADEVREVLGAASERLISTLAWLGSAVEVNVAATWDLERAFAEIAAQPDIAQLAAAARARPAEERIAAQVEVGRRVKAALDERRAQHLERALAELKPIARCTETNPLIADELVFNVALLLDRARLEVLHEATRRLDGAFGHRLTLRCVGPLPAYSFATVTFSRLQAEQLARARRVLGLGEQATRVSVDAAFRRAAVRWHPDLHPGDTTAVDRFSAAVAARDRLVDFMRSQEPLNNPFGPDAAVSLVPGSRGTVVTTTIGRPAALA